MRFGEEELELIPHYTEAGDDIIERLDPWRTWKQPKPWRVWKLKKGVKVEVTLGRLAPRNPKNIVAICVHQTDVESGFGSRDRAHLLERYALTPYHGLYHQRHRLSVMKLPATAYGFSSNGANAYSLALAIDGKFPGDELDAEGFCASLIHCCEVGREQGCPLEFVEAHAQHSNKRLGDPGEEVWGDCVRPTIVQLGLVERPMHVTGTGRRLKESWRKAVPD